MWLYYHINMYNDCCIKINIHVFVSKYCIEKAFLVLDMKWYIIFYRIYFLSNIFQLPLVEYNILADIIAQYFPHWTFKWNIWIYPVHFNLYLSFHSQQSITPFHYLIIFPATGNTTLGCKVEISPSDGMKRKVRREMIGWGRWKQLLIKIA